jgi:hypothetical protein
LVDFLREEPEWRLVKETSRTAVFMKMQDGSQNKEWTRQAYVLHHSRGTALLPKIGYALRLLKQGELGLLFRNALSKLV